jgi:hypothetical protein
MKNGFVRGCRPWFGIDGCHLKGPYGGVEGGKTQEGVVELCFKK